MTHHSSSPKYHQSRGRAILQKIFGNEHEFGIKGVSNKKALDTYKSLKQLKDMLKGGQITEHEYETIKYELLIR